MKLGIGLPHMMPWGLDRKLFLEWARLADEAGFHALGTLDRPNYDSWDVLMSLAAAAAVTERVRLVTSILVLPVRNEVEVAKQAAVIDRISEGRVDLGVGIGNRADDYEAIGSEWERRGPKLRRQVRRMREIWSGSRSSDADNGILGPAPVQEPGIPVIVGGAAEAAVKRAIEIGDGFIFGGGVPAAAVAEQLPKLREQAAAKGKRHYLFYKIQYCAIGEPEKVLEEAAHDLLRYYRNPNMPFDKMVVRGSTGVLKEHARQLAGTGLDVLIYLPAVLDLKQVERIAEDVLPDYRSASSYPASSSEATPR
jgi:alkanesulfonate monooxygenase SsuD/methylene tetrahydromethanopterin reductase-like flavin-dependent oxidoreductase (luciferase family)